LTILADTSALIAVFDSTDPHHERCVDRFIRMRDTDPIVTTNYVVVECLSLIHRRYPLGSVRMFQDLLAPITVEFVDGRVHELGLSSFLAADRRGDSFVDHVSFAFMRDRGVRRAFTLDRDFAREGFDVVP